jgi:predicted GTPase
VAQTRNVVLFGECGVGKSSIINAIVGRPVAKTSNDVLGCTDENVSYSATLDTEIKVNLWDTIGLDEGTAGRIPADQAKQRLKLFLQRRIEASEGVDLLLYCIRGASGTKCLPVKRGHWEKHRFVFEEVCKKRVPVALVVTHLESYDPSGDMDTWWDHNDEKILEFGFQFCAHACIAVLPPEFWDTNSDVNRIEVSRRRLQDLLSREFLAVSVTLDLWRDG